MASINPRSHSPSSSQAPAQTPNAPQCSPETLQSLPVPQTSPVAFTSDSFEMCLPPANGVSGRPGATNAPSMEGPALSLNLRKAVSVKAKSVEQKNQSPFMNEDHKNAFWNECSTSLLWESLSLLGGAAGVAAHTGLAVLGGLATGAKLANDTAGVAKALIGGDKKQALEDCVAGKPAPKGQSAEYYAHYQLFMKIVGQVAPDQCIAQ